MLYLGVTLLQQVFANDRETGSSPFKIDTAAVTFPWLFVENPDFGIFPVYQR